MVPYALHGGDPLDMFKINEYSERIRNDFENGVFEKLIAKHLLKNPHFLKLLYVPDSTKTEREEARVAAYLKKLEKSLSDEEKQTIIEEAKRLKLYQEKLQDHNVLPTLGLDDIQKQIEFTDSEAKYVGKVKVNYFDQPTNGISYVRIKCNTKNLPDRLRLFMPMFKEFLANIGTKNYTYAEFNNKMLGCSSGLSVSLDKYVDSSDHFDINNRNE